MRLKSAVPEARVRLVFLGAAGVGKTALIRRFLHDSFEARHRCTVEELHVLELELELEPPGRAALRLRLELLDTSGSYSFPAMRRLCMRHGDAFVLVYSAHEPGSFEEVRRLRDEILEARPGAVPLLVVANKTDLGPAPGAGEAAARLPAVVQREWGVRHVEASAKQGHNVPQLFQQLLGQISPLRGRLSPALRRRSNPDSLPKEPPTASRRRPLKAPSCTIC
uniref:GTP-binding protein Rhes n=1 Tax=Salvator merianae TaxID=96440 RepID=A0A8D0DTS5_SALMN